jgi:hypothetical protein
MLKYLPKFAGRFICLLLQPIKKLTMKKLLLLLLLLPAITFGQKIKTKKDKVLFDDKEVCILKNVGQDYEFSSLDGTKQFTARYNGLMEDKQVTYQWLTVTSPDGSQVSEVPYEVLQTSFSATNIIIRLLSQKYGLIDMNGINQQKLQEFFSVQRESLSDKYIKNVATAKEEAKAAQAEYAAKVGALRPFVKQDGTVVAGGQMGTRILGKVIPISNYSFRGNYGPITVYDLDRVQVASAALVDNVDNDVNVTLFNGTKFTYRAKRRYTNSENTLFLQQLVEELVARDITLGHQATTYNGRVLNEKVKLAKERSANIYNKKGYAIDEKGVKYEGILTAEFQKLDVHETGNTEVHDQIDTYGKKVSVKYLNEKGRERTTSLTASDGTRFCIKNQDGSETCFVGMKVKGDAMKKIENAMSLGFNNAYFYELAYEANGNMVLRDPVQEDIFVIKLKSAKEGQMIDGRKNEKLSKELSEYLSGCSALSKEIAAGKMDLKAEENLVNIINEYNACKK